MLRSISKYLLVLLILIIVQGLYAQNMPNSTVSIPWSDFRKVLKEIHQDTIRQASVPQIPAAYVVSDAQYSGKMSGEEEFTFRADLEVTVIENRQWIELDIGRGVALYPDVKVDGKPAKIGLRKNGTAFLLIRKPGVHKVSYRFMVTRAEASGQSSLSFPMAGQAVARLSLVLDGEEYRVHANERPLIATKSAKGLFKYSGGLGTGKRAYIRWRQELSRGNGQGALVSGKLNTIYSIGMGVLQMRSQINLTVLHREIREFSFTVPTNLDIIDLTGQAVATWEAKDSAGLRYVTAYLKYSLTETAPFLLQAEMVYPESLSTITLPDITLNGTSRQEGIIGVGVLSNVELTLKDFSNNVLQRDKRELPTWFSDQGDVLFVYHYLSGRYNISLNLKHHDNLPVLDALVRRAVINSVIRDDGKMITRYDMEVHNRGEQFLRCDWNLNWQLWSVYCNGNPARPAFDSIGGQLLIPLDKSSDHTSTTKVRLVYLSNQKNFGFMGEQKVSYPKLNMPMEEVSGSLYIPQNLKSYWWNGNLKRDTTYTTSQRLSNFQDNFDNKINKEITYNKTKSLGLDRIEDISDNEAIAYQSAQGEAGLLSIPVNIAFEGKRLRFSTIMAKPAEELGFSFKYYTVPTPVPSWATTLLLLFTIISGIVVTHALIFGFSIKKIIIGVILPLTISGIISNFLSVGFFWQLIYLIPIIVLFSIIFLKIIGKIKLFFIKRKIDREELKHIFDKGDEDSDDDKEEDYKEKPNED